MIDIRSQINTLDVSRLKRASPTKAEVLTPLLTQDQLVFREVERQLKEHFPRYNGGICCDNLRRDGWEEKTFKEKVDTLYIDTVWWMDPQYKD